jgi:hypothetical protein
MANKTERFYGEMAASDRWWNEIVVNSTKTLDFIPTFLNFFRRLNAPVSDHVTPALILAEMPH